jgi:serine/threonine-protein kinase RsbT
MLKSEFETEMAISEETHIIAARNAVRQVIDEHLNFSVTERMHVVTAVSELARNICKYAKKGVLRISALSDEAGRRGVKLVFQDDGPGIPDLEAAMKPREIFQYQRGMGLGLSGSKKLADEFEILSTVGKGTTITWIKWERKK